MTRRERQELQCWLDQAWSDYQIACATFKMEDAESHARYWYQQAYEKAIKAWGLMHFASRSSHDEAEFRRLFLLRHSPFLSLDSQAAQSLSRKIRLFRRQLATFLGARGDGQILKKIDATLPSTSPDEVSFRYPFKDQELGWVAPRSYPHWERYQGGQMGVEQALWRLLGAVKAEWKTARRNL